MKTPGLGGHIADEILPSYKSKVTRNAKYYRSKVEVVGIAKPSPSANSTPLKATAPSQLEGEKQSEAQPAPADAQALLALDQVPHGRGVGRHNNAILTYAQPNHFSKKIDVQ